MITATSLHIQTTLLRLQFTSYLLSRILICVHLFRSDFQNCFSITQKVCMYNYYTFMTYASVHHLLCFINIIFFLYHLLCFILTIFFPIRQTFLNCSILTIFFSIRLLQIPLFTVQKRTFLYNFQLILFFSYSSGLIFLYIRYKSAFHYTKVCMFNFYIFMNNTLLCFIIFSVSSSSMFHHHHHFPFLSYSLFHHHPLLLHYIKVFMLNF